jgi:hypothetical protein
VRKTRANKRSNEHEHGSIDDVLRIYPDARRALDGQPNRDRKPDRDE